jgi:hypothetical protein
MRPMPRPAFAAAELAFSGAVSFNSAKEGNPMTTMTDDARGQAAVMSEMRSAAVSIIREHIEDLETHEIDQLIFQAFPRITPVDMAAACGAYLAEAKQVAQQHQAELAAFSAWIDEQVALGRPESELTFGAFVRARFTN